MDILQDTLEWYSIPHERNGAVLRVDVCAAGRTRSDVLGLLHALAESTGAALVVLPQPPAVCGMLLVSLMPAPVLQGGAETGTAGQSCGLATTKNNDTRVAGAKQDTIQAQVGPGVPLEETAEPGAPQQGHCTSKK